MSLTADGRDEEEKDGNWVSSEDMISLTLRKERIFQICLPGFSLQSSFPHCLSKDLYFQGTFDTLIPVQPPKERRGQLDAKTQCTLNNTVINSLSSAHVSTCVCS
jgi:hypothetical protein